MLNLCVVNLKVGPLHSQLWLFRCAFGTTSSSHTPVHGLVHSIFPCITKPWLPAMTKRCRNLGTRVYGLVCFVARYGFLHCQAGLNKTWKKRQCKMIQCPLAANFASEVGSCREIVEQFKHLLHATTHPQFWHLSCKCPWALARKIR